VAAVYSVCRDSLNIAGRKNNRLTDSAPDACHDRHDLQVVDFVGRILVLLGYRFGSDIAGSVAVCVNPPPGSSPMAWTLAVAEVAKTFGTPVFEGKTETLGEFRYKKIS